MPATVHVYVFDGYADWEPAFAMAGIRDPQYQRQPGRWQVQTVGQRDGVAVRSKGGLAVLPDVAMDALHADDSALLILPGGDSWVDTPELHRGAIDTASHFFDAGVPVAAICGATAGLARAGWLDDRPHTSNAAAYLKGTGYQGAAHYRDMPAVRGPGLITAGGMAPLEFAREIFIELGLYDDEVLEAWYQLYKTGKSEHFARMVRAAEEPARQLPATQRGPRPGKVTRPSGPGKPTAQRRAEREEIDEATGATASETTRDAHVSVRSKRSGGAKAN
ncbi:MAG TPA: DJ-1/PfpI family protein [Albitalea sp.]|uniref:DJ-1/PfpI family protein n=1 Tax=Piscinibacter sp. TaxID=1903157 RepID=UPI002ED1C3F0